MWRTLDDLSAKYGIPIEELQRAVKCGALHSYKSRLARQYLVREEDFVRYMESGHVKAMDRKVHQSDAL